MTTVQLLRPARGFTIGSPSRTTVRGLRMPVASTKAAVTTKAAVPAPREVRGQSFAAARLAHAIELVSACAVIAIFLAVAMFV